MTSEIEASLCVNEQRLAFFFAWCFLKGPCKSPSCRGSFIVFAANVQCKLPIGPVDFNKATLDHFMTKEFSCEGIFNFLLNDILRRPFPMSTRAQLCRSLFHFPHSGHTR